MTFEVDSAVRYRSITALRLRSSLTAVAADATPNRMLNAPERIEISELLAKHSQRDFVPFPKHYVVEGACGRQETFIVLEVASRASEAALRYSVRIPTAEEVVWHLQLLRSFVPTEALRIAVDVALSAFGWANTRHGDPREILWLALADLRTGVPDALEIRQLFIEDFEREAGNFQRRYAVATINEGDARLTPYVSRLLHDFRTRFPWRKPPAADDVARGLAATIRASRPRQARGFKSKWDALARVMKGIGLALQTDSLKSEASKWRSKRRLALEPSPACTPARYRKI